VSRELGPYQREPSAIFYLACFFCLMPYVGPNILVSSDVQPYAALVCFVALLFVFNRLTFRVPASMAPVVFMSILSSISWLLNIFIYQDDLISATRSLWGYYTSLFVIVFVWTYKAEIILTDSLIKVMDFCLILTFIGFILQILGLNFVVQFFTSRAVFDLGTLSARGLTSFYPEQSRVSEQMLIFLVIYMLLGKLNKTRSAALLIFSIVSFSGQFVVGFLQLILAFFASLSLALLAVKRNIKKSTLLLFISLIVVVVGSIVLNQKIVALVALLELPSRFVSALANLMESPLALLNDKNAQIKFSGIIYAFVAPFSDPLAFDISAETRIRFIEGVFVEASRVAQEIFDIKLYITGRPYTAIGQWGIHFGLFGFLLSAIFLFTMLYSSWRARKVLHLVVGFACCFVLWQLLMLKLPLVNPTLWFAVGILIFRYKFVRSGSESGLEQKGYSGCCGPSSTQLDSDHANN
jgi:hypothetical protein